MLGRAKVESGMSSMSDVVGTWASDAVVQKLLSFLSTMSAAHVGSTHCCMKAAAHCESRLDQLSTDSHET